MTRWAGVWLSITLSAIASSLLSPVAGAEPGHRPVVPGFERFAGGEEHSPAALGRLLIGELNCTSCHAGGEQFGVESSLRKQAPILSDVGDRVRPEWIQEFLNQPHRVKAGTTMPALFEGMSADERQTATTALTHFLASTGTVSDTYLDRLAIKRGEETFRRVGCAACHDDVADGAPKLPNSVPLPKLSAKYSTQSLAEFLRNPHAVRPSARMPSLNLKEEEVRDLVAYFLQDVKVQPNLKFEAFEGGWNDLPDFDTLKAVKTGECAGLDLGVADRPNNYGVRFRGFVRLDKPAQYQFWIGSDDGSRLLVDDEEVVKVGGIHPYSEKQGRVQLDAGWHAVTIEYFQGGGEAELRAEFSGPGLKRQPLAPRMSIAAETPPSADGGFRVDPQLADKGRELFVSARCAACHTLKEDQEFKSDTSKIPSLVKVNGDGGCLAEAPPAHVPHYSLDKAQRAAIAAALAARPAVDELKGEALVRQTLLAFNCYACHRRGEIGGVEEARNAHFQTTMKEMGDEGRLPPTLTGVGDKLREEWLHHVLDQGANDRQQYMLTRMPRFGRPLQHFAKVLAELDVQKETPRPEFPEPEYRVKASGRYLVGGQSLSCIKCHDFGKYPSTGIRAISLTGMTKRLREDWFVRYVADPQEYRRGTRMPAAWPFGTSSVPHVLDGNADLQIRAVWTYLTDGEKAAVPAGLLAEPIELKAVDRPVIYRNFIEGAGARGIGVGYPEHVNLAFDANDMRLALVWHGAFIDASRHWNGRGVGFESPLGDDVIPLAPGMPFAVLQQATDEWPTASARDAGYRFLGYRLGDNHRPRFQYRWNDVLVQDSPAPVAGEGDRPGTLSRSIKIVSGVTPPGGMMRVMVASKIEEKQAGEYLVDGLWTVRLAGADAVVRESKGKHELLVPLSALGTGRELTIDYRW